MSKGLIGTLAIPTRMLERGYTMKSPRLPGKRKLALLPKGSSTAGNPILMRWWIECIMIGTGTGGDNNEFFFFFRYRPS